MPVERYFYHSFARPRQGEEDIEKGLQILESILTNGLLAVPEKYQLNERLQDGSLSNPIEIFQKRICFTELRPHELAAHRQYFGSFAIEWEIPQLLRLGATPVFYLSLYPIDELHKVLGASLVARLLEIQVLLNRLVQLEALANSSFPTESLQSFVSDQPPNPTRATMGGVSDIIQILTHETQPLSQLEAALQFMASFFYATENPDYTDELLTYYRQREWRILANMAVDGERLSRELEQAEQQAILNIDEEFFGCEISFPTGNQSRISQCQFLFPCGDAINSARRIIVPDHTAQPVTQMIEEASLDIELITVSEFDAQHTTDT